LFFSSLLDGNLFYAVGAIIVANRPLHSKPRFWGQ
jgi:hypothetical protein